MIITAAWTADAEGSVTFDFELDRGVTAFVDREWALRGEGVPALLVGPTGDVAWWDGQAIRNRRAGSAADAVSDLRAGNAAIVALAVASVSALPADSRSAVEVTGTGVVAGTIRALLGRPLTPPAENERAFGAGPLAAVDTTGSPAEIMAVAQRLSDCATLVLTGPHSPGPTPVNLYSDVHRRSLRLIGIPPLPDEVHCAEVHVDPPEPAPRRRLAGPAPWYRLDCSETK